jgi:hypothetical protein
VASGGSDQFPVGPSWIHLDGHRVLGTDQKVTIVGHPFNLSAWKQLTLLLFSKVEAGYPTGPGHLYESRSKLALRAVASPLAGGVSDEFRTVQE